VFRGGGWFNYPQFCRATFRNRIAPTLRHYDLGFRVALSLQ
jgi:formylglycine-generating enzyme required for sulfatase activity